jgi:hypothetical protein
VLHAFGTYCLFLAATIALELVVVRMLAPAAQRRRAVTVCAAANLFTHPFATLLSWHWFADLIAIEAVVILAEAACYLRLVPLSAGRAFGLAAAANVFTAFAGLVFWVLASAAWG